MALISTILVAGLEDQVDDFLVSVLINNGYRVRTAIGEAALQESLSESIDLLLLDLPSMSLLPHIPTIRSSYTSALIAIGPIRNDKLLVAALERGADDYIQRPFRTDELLARIRAQLRRRQPSETTMLAFGNLSIDPVARAAFMGGKALECSAEEFSLLSLLATHPGHVYPPVFLLERILGKAQRLNLALLEQMIAHMRDLTEANGAAPRLIHGDLSHGYWFGNERHERAINARSYR